MCILAKMKGWQIWDTAGGRVGITMHCECSPCGVPSPPHPLITMTMMLVLLIYIHAWVITWAGVTWGVTNSQPKTQEIRVIKRVFPLFLLFLRTLLVPNSDWWPLYVPTQPSLFIRHHLSEHPIYQEEVELHSFDKRMPWFWIQLYNHTKYNQNQLKPTNARKKFFLSSSWDVSFNTYRQYWPWWGVGWVSRIFKPGFGMGQGNVIDRIGDIDSG